MVIRDGIVVLPEGLTRIDIRTRGEKIIERAGYLVPEPGESVVDATGLLVLPGFIDSHVHFREPGATHKEDFFSGTQAALAGGVTTILDMPNTQPATDSREHLEQKAALAAGKAVVDYGFYFGATDTNMDEALSAAESVVALKLYMGSSTGSLLVSEFTPMYRHFATFPPHKPIVVHAEDEQALRYFGSLGMQDHNQARPPVSAEIALSRAIAIAGQTGRALHIAHTTTARELELIRAAKQRGIQVTCEVTPLHLFLNENDQHRLLQYPQTDRKNGETLAQPLLPYTSPDTGDSTSSIRRRSSGNASGNYGKVNPPLRSPEDQRALWANFATIDTIATDHAPHTREEKDQPYEKAPSGMPGVQTMLPLLLTAADEGRITLEAIVQRCVTHPARIFGLATKGALAIGKDADIVLVNPQQEYTLTDEQMLSRCGWTPFAGKRVKGKITQVFVRGSLAYDRDTCLAPAGSGKPVVLE